jgi:hypothetical protein
MLGAVKDEGPGGEEPLFRVLARRWKSLAPLKRERPAHSSLSVTEHPEPARAWISKPRRVHANYKPEFEKSKRTWNPWLWVK